MATEATLQLLSELAVDPANLVVVTSTWHRSVLQGCCGHLPNVALVAENGAWVRLPKAALTSSSSLSSSVRASAAVLPSQLTGGTSSAALAESSSWLPLKQAMEGGGEGLYWKSGVRRVVRVSQ